MGQSVVIPEYAGYITAIVASIFWGSNFVPVKKYNTGDGIFFQWMMASAIWILGFIVYLIRGFPPFQPLAMLGGFLWCTGNLMTVPIIQCIGLSLGLTLWGSISLLTGWVTGTFGLFGLKQEPVSIPWMNYLGASLAVVATIVFAFVKPAEKEVVPTDIDSLHTEINYDFPDPDTPNDEASLLQFDKLTPNTRRILGVGMSILSGIFYGSNFTPPQYLMDNCIPCSKNGLDYVFSHFCGIYITSTIYFMTYAILCPALNFKVFAPTEIIAPAFATGVMWAIAQVLGFITNSAISLVIAFPIFSTVPAIVASLWGILVFREITGVRNLALFLTAFLIAVPAVILDALSKFIK